MNRDIASRWTAALRSGEYVQGSGRLAIEYPSGEVEYCVLGVLCDLAHADGVARPRREPARGFVAASEIRYGLTGDGSVLPDEVADWAEAGGPDPVVQWSDGGWTDQSPLTQLNDEAGLTFEELADLIDQQWEFL